MNFILGLGLFKFVAERALGIFGTIFTVSIVCAFPLPVLFRGLSSLLLSVTRIKSPESTSLLNQSNTRPDFNTRYMYIVNETHIIVCKVGVYFSCATQTHTSDREISVEDMDDCSMAVGASSTRLTLGVTLASGDIRPEELSRR